MHVELCMLYWQSHAKPTRTALAMLRRPGCLAVLLSLNFVWTSTVISIWSYITEHLNHSRPRPKSTKMSVQNAYWSYRSQTRKSKDWNWIHREHWSRAEIQLCPQGCNRLQSLDRRIQDFLTEIQDFSWDQVLSETWSRTISPKLQTDYRRTTIINDNPAKSETDH